MPIWIDDATFYHIYPLGLLDAMSAAEDGATSASGLDGSHPDDRLQRALSRPGLPVRHARLRHHRLHARRSPAWLHPAEAASDRREAGVDSISQPSTSTLRPVAAARSSFVLTSNA